MADGRGANGAKVVKLPLTPIYCQTLSASRNSLPRAAAFLALGQMSNVTGGCPDLARAITLAHAAGMVVMVDGACGIVHFPADVQQLDIDFYAFSATSCMAQPALACCTVSRNCWKPCHRGSGRKDD